MILMAGIDYKLAPIEVREKLSFTDELYTSAYKELRGLREITGAVIVSTCNRTEIYAQCTEQTDLFKLLCGFTDVKNGESLTHYSLTGSDVTRHLCLLAGGLLSQILGEDQILAQVKDAISLSREHGASCNTLEVLFQKAIAAAKRIKTEIRLGVRENSIAGKAVKTLNAHGGINRVLVIGNGAIGRLTVSELIKNGFDTTMTLRTYRHGETVVPAGAKTIPYDTRYEKLCEYDALISATRSPHFTISLSKVREMKKYPALWLDLAVPRDIDPEIGKLDGAEYFDVDSLSRGEVWENFEEKRSSAEKIIDEYAADFEKWLDFREKLDSGTEKSEYFPIFVSSRGRKALLVGGGKIASRRVMTLSRFEFDITVTAPHASGEIERMHESGRLTLNKRGFEESDLDGCFLVIAATDNRELNRRIGVLARERGILASIADSREECGFLFPAIAVSGDIVAGISSGGRSHSAAAQAAKRVREVL